MTGFQLTRPRAGGWPETEHAPSGLGRHATAVRARLTVRRLFYVARHAVR